MASKKQPIKWNLETLRKVTVPADKTTVRVSGPDSGLYLKVGKQKACFYLQKRIRGEAGNAKTFFVANLEFVTDIRDVQREARVMAAQCDDGKDPMEEKKTTRGLTLKAAWETFQETRGKTLRDSSMSVYGSQYRTHLQPLEKRDLATFTPEILVKLFIQAESQATAQKALILFNNIWKVSSAVHLKNGKPLLGTSPYDAMKEIIGDAWNEIEKRDVAIVPFDDLGKYVARLEHMAENTLWPGKALHYRIYLLCLFTGLRFHEAATLAWSAVDFDKGSVTVMRDYAKKKREHIAYLCDFTRSLLQNIQVLSISPWVFPQVENAAAHVTKRTDLFREVERDVLDGVFFTSHANRRSFFCFALVECKIPFPTVQKMMSHKSKGSSVAERHYFLLDKFKPGGLKQEFELVGAELVKLRDAFLADHGEGLRLPGQTATIVKLPTAGTEAA